MRGTCDKSNGQQWKRSFASRACTGRAAPHAPPTRHHLWRCVDSGLLMGPPLRRLRRGGGPSGCSSQGGERHLRRGGVGPGRCIAPVILFSDLSLSPRIRIRAGCGSMAAPHDQMKLMGCLKRAASSRPLPNARLCFRKVLFMRVASHFRITLCDKRWKSSRARSISVLERRLFNQTT